jgi:hypothetical protein
MNQLQEISVLLKKRIAHLEKKKQTCLDYSSTPNRCVSKVEAQIARMRKIERIAKLRTRSMESASFVDSYLDMLTEAGPKSPMGKVAVAAATIVGAHKVAKTGIRRSQCKEYKYSSYLHKRCMKGLEEASLGAYTVEKIRKKKKKRQMREAEGMEGLPKGWTQSSLKKFSKSLTGKKATEKGFFDKCVKKMQGKLDNPEGFCASIKDERHGSTYWRGKGKTPQQAGKDVKRIQNVRQEIRGILREEDYIGALGTDSRSAAKEWNGPNLPYGDDSNRPNLIRKCMMVEGKAAKINCLRKLQDQAAMNPYYRSRIDRFVDVITDTYEPTEKPGTIPGNDFEETNVGEDTK